MLSFHQEKYETLGEGEKNFVHNVDICGELRAWINEHKAGSPTDADVYWIHFRPIEISKAFFEASSHRVSHGMIKRELADMGFKYRKLSKNLATGTSLDRQQQFHIICQLILMMSLNSPIISIDCKKKEQIGNLYREGKCYMQGSVEVYDHDYTHLAEGKVIPHGIYDLLHNEAYITIGNSHETAGFITDNLLWWWETYGIHHYPDAKNILILCDAGGGNSYRHHAFKKKLLELAQLIGKDLIICHYPPYASKWNPIEHRLFAHVHRAMQGVVFSNYPIIKELIEKTTTETGLKVFVRIVDKQYDIGIKTDKSEVDSDRIFHNTALPKLSYQIRA